MPHAIRFNFNSARNDLETISRTLGIPSGANALADAFSELNSSIGLPENLGAMGVEYDDLEGIAEAALLDHCGFTNPRPLNQENVQAFLKSAL
jgi:alcohol dehydrogenase